MSTGLIINLISLLVCIACLLVNIAIDGYVVIMVFFVVIVAGLVAFQAAYDLGWLS